MPKMEGDPEIAPGVDRERLARRRDGWFWAIAVLGGVFLYVFGYPVLMIGLFENDLLPDSDLIEYSVVPLEWLDASVPLYEAYIDWVQDWFS